MGDEKYKEAIINLTSNEGKMVHDLFIETMPGNRILSINRVQNKSLWQNYCYERSRMKERGNATELVLFHGTRMTDPMVICKGTEEGFDVRLSAAGAHGRGIYFAEGASYSNAFTHMKANGNRIFIVALVLVGNPFQSGGNGQLTRPPEIPGTKQRYDSVTSGNGGAGTKPCPSAPGAIYLGMRGTQAHYIVYNNNKAYPYYLVEYV